MIAVLRLSHAMSMFRPPLDFVVDVCYMYHYPGIGSSVVMHSCNVILSLSRLGAVITFLFIVNVQDRDGNQKCQHIKLIYKGRQSSIQTGDCISAVKF